MPNLLDCPELVEDILQQSLASTTPFRRDLSTHHVRVQRKQFVATLHSSACTTSSPPVTQDIFRVINVHSKNQLVKSTVYPLTSRSN
ncbi:hypothetical protein J6590_007594 [Homalodisca vitripennis]|nr:hypothetical protein J6590_007594 [Homalodisca vitripennis]